MIAAQCPRTIRHRIRSHHVMVCVISLTIFNNSFAAETAWYHKSNAAATAALQSDKNEVDLEQGKPIEREMKGGEAHTYRIAADSGQFLRLIVDQRGIDVVVRVIGPDGKTITEVDSPNGTKGPEPVSLVAETTGIYRVQVESLEQTAPAGRYEARIEELRLATPQDKMRIDVERGLAEAAQLASQRKAEPLRKAVQKYQEMLPLITTLGDKELESRTLGSIGFIYQSMGDQLRALEYHSRALPVRRALGDGRAVAQTLNNLGAVYSQLGDQPKALTYHKEALLLWRSANDKLGEASTLTNIGIGHERMGENQRGLEYLLQALPLWREVGDRGGEGAAINAIGFAYESMGEHQKGLEYYNEALRLGGGQAPAFSNIGAIYGRLGERQKALELYKKALVIARTAGDRLGESLVLNDMGEVYSALGKPAEALQNYTEALRIRREIGDRLGEGLNIDSIGRAYYALGQLRKALEYYEEALPKHRAVLDKRGEAITLTNMGLAYLYLGEHDKANSLFGQSLVLCREIRSPSLEWSALYSLALSRLKQDDLSATRTVAEQLIQVTENLRTKITGHDLRASYFATLQNCYELYVDVLMRSHQREPSLGNDALALQTSEQARARTLLEMLAEGHADIRQGVDPALLESERSLQYLLDAKTELQTRLLNGKHTEQQAIEMKNEIEQLLAKYQEVQTQIRATSPRYAALTQPRPLTVKEIQQQVVDSNTVLLEYALGEEKSYLWAVTPDSLTSFALPKREVIESAARRVYDLLSSSRQTAATPASPQRSDARGAEVEYNEAAISFSRMILGPVAGQIGKKRLLIVADGALHYVPFAALPLPAPEQIAPKSHRPLLMESHEIINLPSASTLAVLRKQTAGRSRATNAAFVLADPVFDADDPRLAAATRSQPGAGAATDRGAKRPDSPNDVAGELAGSALARSATETGLSGSGELPRLLFTRREADAIYSLTRNAGAKKALDFEANRVTATSPDLSQYRIVHFATHGLLNTEHAELSGIVLSLVDREGKPQNGFFRLYDIYNMNLNAEMVVLSACGTALGKQIKGEGLIGLTRGFMYAGSDRVVATLWRVEDEGAAELMKRFYEALIVQRQRPAEALRSAQSWMQKQKRWQSPHYWAGFVLQGEWK